jgi:isoquinoline 1-oxidoreductase alpha subunit
MPSFTLLVNGKNYTVEADPKMPLLWALRDLVGLTGTKYGCGIAQCGACTVHLNGTPIRSCSTPVSAAANKEIITVEGLSEDNTHYVQKAWMDEQVAQCGYCQSGQIPIQLIKILILLCRAISAGAELTQGSVRRSNLLQK